MYICNLSHLQTLDEGTVFAIYKEDTDGYHVGGMNRLLGVVGREISCKPISSQFHDNKMDSAYGCFLRTQDKVQKDNRSSDYPASHFIDTIYCDGDDYMFAIFSKDDLEEIINDLRTLL